MAETETNFRDELMKLAEVSDIFDNSIFKDGKVSVLVELTPQEYKKVVGYLSPKDINTKQLIISISGIDFTIVLSK